MSSDFLFVPGIAGDADVRAITQALSALPGVAQVVVSVTERRVQVYHTPGVALPALIAAIRSAGYPEVAALA